MTDRKSLIEMHKRSKEYNDFNQNLMTCKQCEYKSCTFQGLLFHEKKHTIVTNVVKDVTNMKNVVTDMTNVMPNMTNVMPAMTSVITDVTNVMPAMTNVVMDMTNVTSVHGGLQIFQLPNTIENNHNVNNGGLQSIATSEITCIQRPIPIETLQNEIAANNAAAANNVHEEQNSKTIPKKFNCDKCHFITDRKGEIEKHKVSKGYFSKDKYSCDQCDYTACTFQNMPFHKKKHNNTSVNFGADQKSHADNMGNIQNETSISKRYKCDKCYYSCDSKSQLSCHKESKDYLIGK